MRSLSPATITLAEAQLAPGTNQVRQVKSGAGRLYWSARGEYYSSQPNAVNTGTFQLSTVREYYKLTPQQNGDKVVYHLDKLSGPVQVGDTLAVRITVGGSDWRYLMIEDPIPSGTESIARDDLYQLDEQPPWWSTRWRRSSRIARRSRYILQLLVPARAVRIYLPAQGGESGHLPRQSHARRAHVSTAIFVH